jgi:hypothetical protein
VQESWRCPNARTRPALPALKKKMVTERMVTALKLLAQ